MQVHLSPALSCHSVDCLVAAGHKILSIALHTCGRNFGTGLIFVVSETALMTPQEKL